MRLEIREGKKNMKLTSYLHIKRLKKKIVIFEVKDKMLFTPQKTYYQIAAVHFGS